MRVKERNYYFILKPVDLSIATLCPITKIYKQLSCIKNVEGLSLWKEQRLLENGDDIIIVMGVYVSLTKKVYFDQRDSLLCWSKCRTNKE